MGFGLQDADLQRQPSFLARPESRSLIAEAFEATLDALAFDLTASLEQQLPAFPCHHLGRPSALPLSYVRSAGKDHGLHNLIEGLGSDGSYHGQRILLIEDLISTGGSSVKAVQAIIAAGGNVPYCLAIFSYGFSAATEAFSAIRPVCEPIALLEYDTLVAVARSAGYVDDAGAALLSAWRTDPFGWGSAHGFPPAPKS